MSCVVYITQFLISKKKNGKKLENTPWRHIGGILGYFGEFFGFWDIFKILYFFIFYKLKKNNV
jgi:hypothetical protein